MRTIWIIGLLTVVLTAVILVPLPSPSTALAADRAAVQSITGDELKAIVKATGQRFTMVNFWATWCPPCVDEFDDLLELRREFVDKGVELLFVSMDLDSEAKQVETFLKKQGMKKTSYRRQGSDEIFINAIDRRWGGVLPTTMLFDANAQIVELWQGETAMAVLRADLNKHLQANPIPKKEKK